MSFVSPFTRTVTLPGFSERIVIAGDLAVLPLDVHLMAAAGAQAGDLAVRPCVRQGGQQADHAAMALHEHFGDRRGAAEIAVDLERRMQAEEVASTRVINSFNSS